MECCEKKPVFRAFILGLCGFGIFFLIALMIWAWGQRGQQSYDQDRAAVRYRNLAKLQQEESLRLRSYGWVDQAKGIAHIPIEKAMQMEAEILKKKTVRPAGAIMAGPAVLPVSAPANAPAVQAPPAQPKTAPAVVPPAAQPKAGKTASATKKKGR